MDDDDRILPIGPAPYLCGRCDGRACEDAEACQRYGCNDRSISVDREAYVAEYSDWIATFETDDTPPLALRLVLAGGLAAYCWWVFPENVLTTPLAQLTLLDIVRLAASVVGAIGIPRVLFGS